MKQFAIQGVVTDKEWMQRRDREPKEVVIERHFRELEHNAGPTLVDELLKVGHCYVRATREHTYDYVMRAEALQLRFLLDAMPMTVYVRPPSLWRRFKNHLRYMTRELTYDGPR